MIKDQKKAAFWETNINIGIGFFLSWSVTELLISVDAWDVLSGLQITAIFTVVSWSRSYIVRRHFNAIIKAISRKIAG
jgi:hypothetical protein